MPMDIQHIDCSQGQDLTISLRPSSFDAFIWQKDIKNILSKAVASAHKRKSSLGHVLFSGSSGFGKTSLAHIVAQELWVQIQIITGYAIAKPSDLISILTNLQEHDILFIDEIHRLKPAIEEILYIAMEDHAVDMVMPDGSSVRVPLKPFTLVGATTKMESLSEPFKNRFVYSFHFVDYTEEEKIRIVQRYLDLYEVIYDSGVLSLIATKVDSVPRRIHNLCVQIRDFYVTHTVTKFDVSVWKECESWLQIEDGGITPLHRKYLSILANQDRPLGVKTIALQLGIHERSVEEDIEPLLLKLWKIEKTGQWRILIEL